MKTCGGKKVFTKREAESASNARLDPRSRRGRHKKRGTPDSLRIYPCDRCNGWHLTSKSIEDFESKPDRGGSSEWQEFLKKQEEKEVQDERKAKHGRFDRPFESRPFYDQARLLRLPNDVLD